MYPSIRRNQLNTPLLTLKQFCYPKYLKEGGVVYSQPLDLELSRGEILVVTGISGVGKTIMMNCILGLTPQVLGAHKINDSYAVLHSQNNLDLDTSISENFIEYYNAYGIPYNMNQIREEIFLFTKESLDQKVCNCSLGTQRRLALLRILLCPKTRLFFLDEPTTGMDAPLISKITRKITDLKGRNECGFWIISHEKLVMGLADKLVLLSQGLTSVINKKRSSGFIYIRQKLDLQLPGEKIYWDPGNLLSVYRYYDTYVWEQAIKTLQENKIVFSKNWPLKQDTIREITKTMFHASGLN